MKKGLLNVFPKGVAIMPIRKTIVLIMLLGLLVQISWAQEDGGEEFDISTPDVFASMAIGFNYDYLRSPLRVDYDRARGMFGINIPFAFKPSDEMMGTLLSDVSDNFTDGQYFAPSVSVKQFANTTLQVDVPFFGGVLQWSHMRMINVNYSNQIGLSNFTYHPDTLPGGAMPEGTSIDLLLKGNMAVPIAFDLGWETMTFGYAYKINDMFEVALNMHRHYFYFDVLGNVDIDLLGKIDVEYEENGVSIPVEINPDYSLHNQVDGFYDLKKWTPTIAASAWRFQFIARFGFKDYAKGELYGGYTVPFFIDPETFEVDELSAEYILDNLGKFQNNETNSVTYSTKNDLLWQMPHGFTFGFDIIPERLNISYTKMANSIRMELVDEEFQEDGDGDEDGLDTLDFRFAANVDHLVLLQGHFPWIYFKLGIFALDVEFAGERHLLSNVNGMIDYGDGVMMPILGGGLILGDKMQFKGEINLAPFPAINTGIIYHF